MPRAIVLAGAADAAGLSPLALARMIGYDDAQTVASAALKLHPMDPVEATRWVRDALPGVERVAQSVAHLTDPADIPATGAPQFDAWAEAHAVTTRRLFSA
jgi:urease accessory protein